VHVSFAHNAARIEVFRSAPIPKAVAKLAIPTVISQLIAMIYNVTDTFFVGQLGDPRKVAAVSLVMPAFTMLTALANLFGVGGSSVMSRFLGAGKPQKAKLTSSFCLLASIIVAGIFSIFAFYFSKAASYAAWRERRNL